MVTHTHLTHLVAGSRAQRTGSPTLPIPSPASRLSHVSRDDLGSGRDRSLPLAVVGSTAAEPNSKPCEPGLPGQARRRNVPTRAPGPHTHRQHHRQRPARRAAGTSRADIVGFLHGQRLRLQRNRSRPRAVPTTCFQSRPERRRRLDVSQRGRHLCDGGNDAARRQLHPDHSAQSTVSRRSLAAPRVATGGDTP